VGDQFALMEAVVALAVVLRRYSFRAVPGRDPGMTTGGCEMTRSAQCVFPLALMHTGWLPATSIGRCCTAHGRHTVQLRQTPW
jgi:hypothetical protein